MLAGTVLGLGGFDTLSRRSTRFFPAPAKDGLLVQLLLSFQLTPLPIRSTVMISGRNCLSPRLPLSFYLMAVAAFSSSSRTVARGVHDCFFFRLSFQDHPSFLVLRHVQIERLPVFSS